MNWTLTNDLEEFDAEAGGFLREDPVRNTVQLTALERLRAGVPYSDEAPLFGWWRAERVESALLHTPPFPVLLASLRDAEDLADLLGDREIAGVNGSAEEADAFAAIWRERTGRRSRTERRSRLYRLAQLTPVTAPGTARVAADSDRGLLVDWMAAFETEAGGVMTDHEGAVTDRLGYGGLTLWEVNGQPVSLAGLTRPAAGVIRVGPVYTPPEHRRHGYGAAVTSAVTRRALDGGYQVVLFTDLANPVSNSIYQRIGYRAVEDRLVLAFT